MAARRGERIDRQWESPLRTIDPGNGLTTGTEQFDLPGSASTDELVTTVRAGDYRRRDRLEQESVAVDTMTADVIEVPGEAVRRSGRLGRRSASDA